MIFRNWKNIERYSIFQKSSGDRQGENVLQIRNPHMFCSGGKGDSITIEDIGGETIASEKSEKILGLHINSSFKWDTHIEKLVLELKKG